MIRQQPMSVEQVQRGLLAAKAIGAREFAMAKLASLHGLRVSELAKLKVSDINFKDSTISIVPGKGSESTVEHLSEDVATAVREWLNIRGNGTYLFPGQRSDQHLTRQAMYLIFRGIAERAGNPDTCRATHSWRHSIGQRLADQGVAIQTIAKVLRHRSIKSTQHYFKVSQRTADAAKAMHLGW